MAIEFEIWRFQDRESEGLEMDIKELSMGFGMKD